MTAFPDSDTVFSRRFDSANRHWSPRLVDNRTFLQAIETYCNDMLEAKGYIFVNDVQDILGYDRTPSGQLVGWCKEEGSNPVKFNITEVEEEPNVFILTLNPDGIMYHKI